MTSPGGQAVPASGAVGAKGASPRRGWADAALALAGLLFSLLAVELLLYLKPEWQFASDSVEEVVLCDGATHRVRPDERYGWLEAPNTAYFMRRSEADGWILHVNDAQGFRLQERTGERNVVVLGDSFARGASVGGDGTIPQLLDRWNEGVAFHNWGVSGYGTADAMRLYEGIGGRVDHGLVVLAHYLGNDVQNNLARFRLGEGGAIEPLPPRPESASWRDRLPEPIAGGVVVAQRALRQSRAYSMAYDGTKALLGGGGLSPGELARGLELTGAALRGIAGSARERGADLLVVALPSWNEATGRGDAESSAAQRRLIGDLARDLPWVHALDLAPAVAEVGAERFFGLVDKHYSQQGYHAAAAAVQGWLRDEWDGPPTPVPPAAAFVPTPQPAGPRCDAIGKD